MAVTPRLLSLSRLLTTTAPTTVLRRTFSSSAALSIPRFSLLRTISAVRIPTTVALPSSSFRCFATRNSMNDNSPNRPPNETILLDGCDFEHWLVVTDPPPEDWTRDQIIDYYIKLLAQVVGSEEEARMKIYSVSTKCYFAFGALVSEELSGKLKEMEKIRWVLPDSYLDVKNKDYGGEPFIDGQAVPYDPKYHEEWARNNQKAGERNHRTDRSRNADRSRNFDRRQNMPARNQLGSSMGGPPPNQHSGAPPQNAGYQQNMPPNNAGYQQNMPPSNAGYQQNIPPSNAGYQQNMPPNNAGYQQNIPPSNAGYQQNMPPNNAGYQQNIPPNNAGYGQNIPPNNAGYGQNIPPNNAGYRQTMPPDNQGFSQNMPPPNNMSGNYGGRGNPGFSNNNVPNYQAGGGLPYQNNAPVGNGGYQGQNVPGRDMP